MNKIIIGHFKLKVIFTHKPTLYLKCKVPVREIPGPFKFQLIPIPAFITK